jgi:hypothetical protein
MRINPIAPRFSAIYTPEYGPLPDKLEELLEGHSEDVKRVVKECRERYATDTEIKFLRQEIKPHTKWLKVNHHLLQPFGGG